MPVKRPVYRAIFSSDWNECLAPCGPFDFIAFSHPELGGGLTAIFREYTSNAITLGDAVRRLDEMLPQPISPDAMDAYLEASFEAYPGLAEWIEWCRSRDILFMINTTGMVGYFQRIFAKRLLPRIPALSAHPMIRFEPLPTDPESIFELLEIQDKPRNTEAAMGSFGITTGKVIVMGDSGGDGPHFEWGSRVGALLIGSRTKPSLKTYCDRKGISIAVELAVAARGDDLSTSSRLAGTHFMDLAPAVEEYLAR